MILGIFIRLCAITDPFVHLFLEQNVYNILSVSLFRILELMDAINIIGLEIGKKGVLLRINAISWIIVEIEKNIVNQNKLRRSSSTITMHVMNISS